ncbi:hypothetical protein [Aeromonas rivuli]|uniref:hypothetical protein n=1 Tax=Aeromonas rivuli TaxID=648794 RepID=UPI001CC9D3F2|nr:hypothetical protein [Aeromonas rivuli]UBO72464.1 hypothetical protein KYK33_11220 [Aeromonas rivuli]
MNEQHTDNLSPLQGEALRNYIEDTYRELEKEPVLYQWNINHKQHHATFMGVAQFFILGALATYAAGQSDLLFSTTHLIYMLVVMFIAISARYLFAPNQLYHYHITAKGFFYTQQDNIPDIAFTIARGLGWFGCGVCVLAAGMLGPAAFIGAGASALLAWKIKDIQPVEKKNVCLFVKNEKKMTIRLFERKSAIKFIVSPLSPYTYAFIYCKEGESGKVMQLLSPYIAAYDVIKVNSWREF